MRAGYLLLVVVLWGCADSGRERSDRLVVYSAGPRGLAEKICAAFTAETGIEVDLFQATTGQLMARLEAERYRPRADVVLFASEVAAAALKSENRLRRFVPDSPGPLREDWSDPDGFYHASAAALVGVAVPGDLETVPETWAEWLSVPDGLLLTMPSPSRSGAAGDFLVAYTVNVPEAMDQFHRARARGLEFAAANSQAISSLNMGAAHGILGAVDYLIYRQIENGEPLRMVFPADGAVLVTRPIAILSDAANPEGAERFVTYYFGDFAQRAAAAAHLLPGRTDIAPSPVRDPEPENLLRADPETALRLQSSILRNFQVRIERAVIPREAGR
ncbi:MAG: extracellular solute-binding protein [Verrucomicrobia bacterium]|nr:extracellular solute-binding protein [Verrucomicrobiota bacterium]MCH8525777.1 extracellular solute-binding protein [Kiritimatiellia bacterium]